MAAQDTVVAPGPGRGLRRDGTIEREGALDRVPAEFVPVVNAARARVTQTFGTRMHGTYLYGSIPAVLRLLIDDLGPWLAAEYTAVHGAKAPRPGA